MDEVFVFVVKFFRDKRHFQRHFIQRMFCELDGRDGIYILIVFWWQGACIRDDGRNMVLGGDSDLNLLATVLDSLRDEFLQTSHIRGLLYLNLFYFGGIFVQ